MNKKQFQVDLGGIINILSNHLYTSSDVFLRELIQNGKDAIAAANEIESEGFLPEIRIEYSKEGQEITLLFEDNGIGLTAEEIEKFLSSVGSSVKRKEGFNRSKNFIGQFGIGLLSCFMVTEQIVMITKSRKDGKAFKWVGFADGNYTYDELTADQFEYGTKVYLTLKAEIRDYYPVEKIEELVKRYANHLEIPILIINQNSSPHQVNEIGFPWEGDVSSYDEPKQEILDYGRTAFNIQFTDYIPIKIDSLGVEGVAFISPTAYRDQHQQHRVYLKRMFITPNGANIIPDWSFFLHFVLNTSQLSPTASREEFYDDFNAQQVKDELEKSIKDYFHHLSETDSALLTKIIHQHFLAFKSRASTDTDFFNLISPWLNFRTSLGELSLSEIVQEDQSIQYMIDLDAFRQISPIAQSRNTLIVNAAYVYDLQLLEMYAEQNSVRLIEAESTDLSDLLESISIEERNSFFDFMQRANRVLQDFDVEVDLKLYEPSSLPAMFFVSSSGKTKRNIKKAKEKSNPLFGAMLDQALNDQVSTQSKLFLNLNCQIIQKLSKKWKSTNFEHFVMSIYINALLMGHHSVSGKELSFLSNAMTVLMEESLKD